MLLSIAGVLALLWILGLVFHVLGGAIHILLVIAVIVAIVHFFKGGKTV